MKKYTILKLIGIVILTMIVLVLLSFIEVAIYSYSVNPGQTEKFYEEHANITAPYISGIFGFIIFFLVVRYWRKKGYEELGKLAILYPLIYVLLDIIIISAAGVKWSEFILIFLVANVAKILGAYLGYKSRI